MIWLLVIGVLVIIFGGIVQQWTDLWEDDPSMRPWIVGLFFTVATIVVIGVIRGGGGE